MAGEEVAPSSFSPEEIQQAAEIARALLLRGGSGGGTAEAEIARILGDMSEARVVASLIAANPRLPASGGGPAANAQALEDLVIKGFYAINATKRLAGAENREGAIRREAAYHDLHVGAIGVREGAAQAVDEAAARHGNTLGWYGINDDATTVDCREAIGKNFQATTRPPQNWPGATHMRCRCHPGPPYPNAALIN